MRGRRASTLRSTTFVDVRSREWDSSGGEHVSARAPAVNRRLLATGCPVSQGERAARCSQGVGTREGARVGRPRGPMPAFGRAHARGRRAAARTLAERHAVTACDRVRQRVTAC